MEPPALRLEQIQRWMQAVITHPGGVAEGLSSEAAREALGGTSEDVRDIVPPSQRQSAEERLEIYASAYFARLMECLREDFPVLRRTLGDETFDSFALEYLVRYPSRSYTLGRLADRFLDFLRETRPEPERDSDEPDWPAFVIDLATLEWHINRVFDGPGSEKLPPLSATELSALPAEAWPHARLIATPSLRLLPLRFPINAYYTAARQSEELPETPLPAESWVAVWRRDWVVRRQDLELPQYVLLHELSAGRAVGPSIERAAGSVADADLPRFAESLRGWFAEWVQARMVIGVEKA